MGPLTTLRHYRWQLAQHLDYHVGEAIRFHHFRHVVEPLITPETRDILDAGSGAGKHAFYLAQRYPHIRVLGVDNRADVIERTHAEAQARGLTNLHFQVADLTSSLPQNAFDIIYSIDVLEHIPEDRKAIAHMAQALRPGGHLAVHTPLTPQTHWFRRFDLDHLVNPLHAREGYRRGELEEKMAEAGLHVSRVVFTHGRWGTLAWELWKWSRYRIARTLLVRPLIHVLIAIEARQHLQDGNCVFVVGTKPA